MRLGPPSTLLLVLALLLALAGPPGVAAGAPAAAPDRAPVPDRPALQAGTFDPNVTVLELEITADGDARWTVTHRFDLADTNDTRAFERLAEEFERGDVGGNYLRTMERAAEAADEGTDREMAIRNVSRNRVVENGTGRLVTRLTWTSFGRVTGDTVRVNDAFELGTGTWLPGLTADERLVVSPPTGYRIDTAPSADSFRNGSLVWEGPTAFEPGYLSITYRKLTPPPEPPNATDSASPPPGPFDGQLLPIVGGLFGVGLLLLVVYLFLRRETPFGPVAEANGGIDSDASSGPDSGEAGASAVEATGAEPPSEPTGEAGADEPEPTDGDEGGDAEEEPVGDPELLSDEERVERLLRRNGGRMKQANIVRETNWSNAKVSQLLSSMDEAGRIDKLRIGRENLITLPDEEPGELGE
ncbi:MAG: hypothetical protein V5A62_14535 [Haloarculaceae archaeon]